MMYAKMRLRLEHVNLLRTIAFRQTRELQKFVTYNEKFWLHCCCTGGDVVQCTWHV